VIITGHRGALGSEPENTLRSFRRAAADGCDEIELDLRVTADGELVVLHDATVDRTTDGTGAVADLSFDVLRSRLCPWVSKQRSRPPPRSPCWRNR